MSEMSDYSQRENQFTAADEAKGEPGCTAHFGIVEESAMGA
jgi:hypothetical protein